MGNRLFIVKRIIGVCLAVSILITSVAFPSIEAKAAGETVLETNVSAASSGNVMLGVYGTYYTDAENALNRINEIRYEACNAGNVPDPRDSSRMLAPSDYVPLAWSRDLEQIARIRAVEGGLARSIFGSGHNRLNKKEIWFYYNGVKAESENLAYNDNRGDLVSGINQWYGEKSDWINQVAGTVTGHYTSIINPNYKSIGLGDFYAEETGQNWPNTLCGLLSTRSGLNAETLPAYTNIIQKIEVYSYYVIHALEGSKKMFAGESQTVLPRARVSQESLVTASNSYIFRILGNVTLSSSAEDVCSVDENGLVVAKGTGTATISAKSGSTTLATLTINVTCNHNKQLQNTNPATCQQTGTNYYSCSKCGEDFTETIPVAAHNYVYGAADSSGMSTGTCSVCNDTITIKPPKNYTIYWRNPTTAADGYYWTYPPTSNPIGSKISLWVNGFDGQEGYNNLIVESSDEDVISVSNNGELKPANASDGGMLDLSVIRTGIVTLTVYPKYNSTLKKTFTLRVGNPGGAKISDAEVTLSKSSYDYTGSACKPSVNSIQYRGVTLTRGTDYESTLTYVNNTNAGTAKVIITGAGIFGGTLEKEFTINPINLSGYQATLATTGYEHDGTAKTPTVTVKKTSTSTALRKDQDYEVTYENNDQIGTATVSIQGVGNYSGTITKTFNIVHTKHIFEGEWKRTVEPTCIKKGSAVQKCRYCDTTQSKEVDFAAHNPVTGEPKASTYKERGHEANTNCSVCNILISSGVVTPELKFNVHFDGNDADTGDMPDQTGLSYIEGATLHKNAFAKEAYLFSSWNTDKNGNGVSVSDEANIKNIEELADLAEENNGQITLYAQWKEACRIAYALNGGINNDNNPRYYFIGSRLKLYEATKTGYTFDGWFLDEDLEKAFSGITEDMTDGITLYAKWKPITYSIAFNINGGSSGTMKTISGVEYDQSFKLPSNTFSTTKVGYTFGGWSTSADGEIEYENEGSVKNLRDTVGTVTLYAKWKPIDYTIRYVGATEGERMAAGNPDKYNLKQVVTLNNPKRNGYRFVGWYTDAKFTKSTTGIKIGSTGVKTFYAKWEPYKLTLEFYPNKPSEEDTSIPSSKKSIEIPYNQTANIGAEGFYREKYAFSHWSDTPEGMDKETNESDYTKNGTYTNTETLEDDKTVQLYAQWKTIDPYKYILFRGNGAAQTTANVFSYLDEEVTDSSKTRLPKNTFTKKGYKFIGWSTKASPQEGDVLIAEDTEVDSDKQVGKKLYEIRSVLTNPTVTLFAQWEVIHYPIIYKDSHTDENIADAPADTYTINGAFDLTTFKPHKDGYTFAGWYTTKNSKTRATTIKKGSTGEKTYYAKWTPITYKIVFDKADETATGKMSSITATYKKPFTLPTNAYKKKGFYFAGWKLADREVVSYADKDKVEENLTAEKGATISLKAVWKPGYTITYKDITVAERDAASLPVAYDGTADVTFENVPTRGGYTFDGFYRDSKKKTKIEQDEVAIKQTETDSKTFYANWTENNYTIEFEKGTGAYGEIPVGADMLPLKAKYAKNIALTKNTYSIPGYTFDCWNTNEDGTGTKYANRASVKNLTTDNDGSVTLYAQWKKNSYKVSFADYNAKTDTPDNLPKTYAVVDGLDSLPSLTRLGYSFEGWYKDSKKNNVLEGKAIEPGITGSNKTFYAKWNPHTYNVFFEKGEGEVTGTTKPMNGLKSGKTITLLANGFKRTGYTFVGWEVKDGDQTFTNKQRINPAVFGKEDEAAENTVTLVAKWTPTVYKITYKDMLKGQSGVKVDVTHTYNVEKGNILHPIPPERDGYTFGGWYTKANGKGTNSDRISSGTMGNKTYYAYWLPNSYTIVLQRGEGNTGEVPTGVDMKPISMKYDKGLGLPNVSYSLLGYTFAGWKVEGLNPDTIYGNKKTVKNLTSENNGTVILTAQWKKK